MYVVYQEVAVKKQQWKIQRILNFYYQCIAPAILPREMLHSKTIVCGNTPAKTVIFICKEKKRLST